MSKKSKLSPIATAVGVSVVASLASLPMANAASNPFAAADIGSGYTQLAEGKCGEGKCGGKKAKKDGKCGEGKCGGDKKGKAEGKCGEGKCGGKKDKKEGKCGEGKCGGKK